MSTQPQDDETRPDASPDATQATPAAGTPRKPDAEPKAPITTNRIVLWAIVAAVGLYFVVSGVYGILVK
jgi:hypothetical protein